MERRGRCLEMESRDREPKVLDGWTVKTTWDGGEKAGETVAKVESGEHPGGGGHGPRHGSNLTERRLWPWGAGRLVCEKKTNGQHGGGLWGSRDLGEQGVRCQFRQAVKAEGSGRRGLGSGQEGVFTMEDSQDPAGRGA